MVSNALKKVQHGIFGGIVALKNHVLASNVHLPDAYKLPNLRLVEPCLNVSVASTIFYWVIIGSVGAFLPYYVRFE